MQEIKKFYALEWFGPYDSVDEIYRDDDTEACSIYLITGKASYERGGERIKYVGITERDPAKRLSDKDHLKKQQDIHCLKFWLGKFSKRSNKNSRSHAELIEKLFVRYLYLSDTSIINCKKKKSPLNSPVVVLNRWLLKGSYQHRQNKPASLKCLPDVIMFDGEEYWGADRLVLQVVNESVE